MIEPPSSNWLRLLEALATIQATTRVRIATPERTVTLEEAQSVFSTEAIVKTGIATYSGTGRITVGVDATYAAAVLDEAASGKPIALRLRRDSEMVEIFGHELSLGPSLIFGDGLTMQHSDVADLQASLAARPVDGEVELKLQADERTKLTVYYPAWLSSSDADELKRHLPAEEI